MKRDQKSTLKVSMTYQSQYLFAINSYLKYLLAARHRAIRQRTVSLCRRNSETCSIIADISRSHISLNQLHLPRRQMSLTQSEPESDKEGATTGKKHFEVRLKYMISYL